MAFPRTVLPLLPADDQFADQPSLQQAYDRLRTYEVGHSTPQTGSLTARWLGHLLREFPRKEIFASEITSCADDAAIEDLGKFTLNPVSQLSPLGVRHQLLQTTPVVPLSMQSKS